VRQLLQEKRTVIAALRSVRDDKTADLRSIWADVGTGKLSFVQFDLRDESSLVAASKNCDAIIHLASPFSLKTPKDPQAEIILPAVEGACNAVKAAKTHSIRLVLCSSVFGVMGSTTERGENHLYTSADVNEFNTPGGCTYAYSKKAADVAAAKLAKQSDVDLVTLCPGP